MSIRNQSVLAMRWPGAHEIAPASTSLQICVPKIVSTPSSAPALIIMREPTEHSSAGWNSKRTSPWISSVMPKRMRAAPSSMDIWQSWPHACMTPSFSDAYGAPVSSVTGRASMSLRSAIRRRGFPSASYASGAVPLMVAIIPFPGTRVYSMPIEARRQQRAFAVSVSFSDSSGCLWK